ncbi:hypothetical protein KY342_03580 [Candidatus Woesearchaeota archaeon]|nr:hypothetical protein [Candidatus Woesearchaeota archaeon]
MYKKSELPSYLIPAIIGIAVFIVIAIITIYPQIEKGKEFIQLEEACKETGKKIDEYHIEIENLLDNYNPSLAEAERINKEKEIIDLYKEYKQCFPKNTLVLFMEDVDQKTVFSFILVLKNSKHYDDTTIKIAERFTIRFPTSVYISDVNDYIKQAKS